MTGSSESLSTLGNSQQPFWRVFWLTAWLELVTMRTTQMDSAPARFMMCPSGAGKRLSDNQIEKSGRMSAPEEWCQQKRFASFFACWAQTTHQFEVRISERRKPLSGFGVSESQPFSFSAFCFLLSALTINSPHR